MRWIVLPSFLFLNNCGSVKVFLESLPDDCDDIFLFYLSPLFLQENIGTSFIKSTNKFPCSLRLRDFIPKLEFFFPQIWSRKKKEDTRRGLAQIKESLQKVIICFLMCFDLFGARPHGRCRARRHKTLSRADVLFWNEILLLSLTGNVAATSQRDAFDSLL